MIQPWLITRFLKMASLLSCWQRYDLMSVFKTQKWLSLFFEAAWHWDWWVCNALLPCFPTMHVLHLSSVVMKLILRLKVEDLWSSLTYRT
jgi:hypothetical protein